MGVGHGGVTPYQYRWRVFDGTRWTVLRDWSTSNIYTWTPVVASPMYQIEVAVRSATGELAVARVPFAIQ
jgi:hypothetical protein